MIVVAAQAPLGWTALRNGDVIGALRALIRPDRRCQLLPRDVAAEALGPLLDAAVDALRRDVYVEVDEAADDAQRVLAAKGFTVSRREHRYLVPTDPSRNALGRRPVPDGFGFVSAAEADVERLRELDDALRQDVPGTAGWRNDPADFARQLFTDPQFDPATYLLAVDGDTGRYVGLVRVWNRPVGPRLGLIGVLPAYRGRGLAIALLNQAFGVLHRRGRSAVDCEVDHTNTASNALLTGLGARRVGGNVEWVRRFS